MKRQTVLRHEFVEFIPKVIPDGVIYVSIPYTTVIHNCCCGCGVRVVTPLSPVDWTLIFDGRSISLDPSIGNWSFPCRSHYWIRNNKVVWSRKWSEAEISSARRKDDRAAAAYFGTGNNETPHEITGQTKGKKAKSGIKKRIKKLFGGEDVS